MWGCKGGFVVEFSDPHSLFLNWILKNSIHIIIVYKYELGSGNN